MKIGDLEKVFKIYVDNNKGNFTDICNIDTIIERHKIIIENYIYKESNVKEILKNKIKLAINLESGVDKSVFWDLVL
jgi:hypothetical protein